jgi:hypothetical protein
MNVVYFYRKSHTYYMYTYLISLFRLGAEWHTLAKMRLHTDSTLAWLDESTKAFGKQIRRFQSYTCSFFDTRELPQEEAARSRRQKKKKVSQNLPNLSPIALAPSTATTAQLPAALPIHVSAVLSPSSVS